MRKTLIKNEFLTVSQEFNWHTKNIIFTINFDSEYYLSTNSHTECFKILGFPFGYKHNTYWKMHCVIREMILEVSQDDAPALGACLKSIVRHLNKLQKNERL